MRDINKQEQQGKEIMKKNMRADLTAGELMQFRDAFIDTFKKKGYIEAMYKIVCTAFYMGFAVGHRAGKREASKKTTASKKTAA